MTLETYETKPRVQIPIRIDETLHRKFNQISASNPHTEVKTNPYRSRTTLSQH
jgi:hypothetical protein